MSRDFDAHAHESFRRSIPRIPKKTNSSILLGRLLKDAPTLELNFSCPLAVM